MPETTTPATEPATKQAHTVDEAMRALNLSRQSLYDEINSGRLASYKYGSRRFVPVQAEIEWIGRMVADGGITTASRRAEKQAQRAAAE
ncbi:MAG: helix-turn-helix domain-containing protein [Thiocapsa sp.]|uniref:helix-turn-helix domain-containing protein n=1 Tax=Thiocapsa sp. TaxID=2024551 RepID=UPI001BCCC9C4|nr:helix-turn-helix domain-containing protein [Thiocapsa sp.]QVL50780.1 MAG: helix-turn-helix domain-containing protein [Thiocapsa sp.]